MVQWWECTKLGRVHGEWSINGGGIHGSGAPILSNRRRCNRPKRLTFEAETLSQGILLGRANSSPLGRSWDCQGGARAWGSGIGHTVVYEREQSGNRGGSKKWNAGRDIPTMEGSQR